MNKEEIKKQILDAANFRFACRDYDKNKKISDEDFNFILEIGRLSPSSFGLEPWKFLVIKDNQELKQKIRKISHGAEKQLDSCSHFVIVLARKKIDTKYGSEYIVNMLNNVRKVPEEWVEGFNNSLGEFQNGSFNLFESDRAIFDWATKQTYIPLGNMMSAAAQIGIDSCAVEGFDKNELEKLLTEENIIDPEHFGVSCLLAFGYREHGPAFPKTRNPFEDVVEFVD